MLNKKKVNKAVWLRVMVLQGAVCLYTLSSIAAKKASAYGIYSVGFFLWLVVELFFLGIYAIIWQQIIKYVDISIAYANRAMAIFWSMLWAFLLFQEQITIKNLLGVVLIFIGTWVVNSSD